MHLDTSKKSWKRIPYIWRNLEDFFISVNVAFGLVTIPAKNYTPALKTESENFIEYSNNAQSFFKRIHESKTLSETWKLRQRKKTAILITSIATSSLCVEKWKSVKHLNGKMRWMIQRKKKQNEQIKPKKK